jgi:alpha-ketoglutarate-dependent 2,4-dichlorophenoxyacetate dioxygenase
MPVNTVVPHWTVRKLHPRFAAELSGHRIGGSLDPALSREVRDAVYRFGVVVIPGQDLADDELHVFAQSLGKVMQLNAVTGKPSGVFRLSNLDLQGNILPATDRAVRMSDGNELWHTDSTYVRPRATISLLHARIIPPEGGNTEYCDTRCAYEDLSAEMQGTVAGLSACHSLIYSRALTGFTEWTAEERQRFAPVERPLVHRHHESDRLALCLASHIGELKPLAREQWQPLLQALMAAATAPTAVYAHRWQVGDLLLWDNRCTMHRVRPYDQLRYRRDMRSIRLDDEADA